MISYTLDLLFMTTTTFPTYKTTSKTGSYRNCTYVIYVGDRFLITNKVLKSSLGKKIEHQGIVFNSLEKLKTYVDKAKNSKKDKNMKINKDEMKEEK